jgi:hypothetical protein
MDAEEWAEFDAVLRGVVAGLAIDVERYEKDAIFIRDRGRFGLLNLAQLCQANPRGDWPQILRQHLTAVMGTPFTHELFNFARLRVRLFPDEYFTTESRRSTITCAYTAE